MKPSLCGAVHGVDEMLAASGTLQQLRQVWHADYILNGFELGIVEMMEVSLLMNDGLLSRAENLLTHLFHQREQMMMHTFIERITDLDVMFREFLRSYQRG